jgi:large subunit ribosomal protein L2
MTNNVGRVAVRWRGGGYKGAHRIIDFKRRKLGVPATVELLEFSHLIIIVLELEESA